MIGLDEAQARLIALGTAVSPEVIPLAQAIGRWTSAPVTALRTQPAADLSAMDGYAIGFQDRPGPWTVVGESAAGLAFAGELNAGQAVRIFTGAPLPTGSDTILIQEHVSRDGDSLMLNGPGPARIGDAVRKAGEDFTIAAVLIDAGARVTPARIALAAMGGHATLPVHRIIKLAIATTGNELVPVGSAPDAGLPDSNGPMLTAQLAGMGVDITLFRVGDSLDAMRVLFADAQAFDVLVTTGGASVGDHDLVRPALIAAGATPDFWKVAIRPGKPVMAARLGNVVVLGLPGNPVSAFVTAELFLKPLIAHLSGAHDPLPARITVEAGSPFPAVGDRDDFVRARWRDGCLVPVRAGDSGAVFPLAEARALVIRAAGSIEAPSGARVEAILLA